ncbi:MAG TPA: helix-turn-helix domain-containing protein, partial [Silvibacterium sp.]|nr:helix-turn-helix domain-containing protein [Silvibacterium sp.]
MRKKKTANHPEKRSKNSASVALDPGVLASSLGFALRMASNAATQRFHQVMRPFHIRPAQFSTLILIHANPGVRQRDICEALRIEKA